MRPLRIKASSTPISSSNFQGLQEMTDGEINQYLSYVLTNKFSSDTDGTGTAELNVDTANALPGVSIGNYYTPMIPRLSKEVQNPIHIIPEDNAKEWVRGGVNSRDIFKQLDYKQRCNYKDNSNNNNNLNNNF